MNILLWIILGGLAGWVASLIMHRDEGLIADVIIGIIGALLGGWLFGLFGGPTVTGFNLLSFVVAVVGSIVLLFIINLFRGNSNRPRY